MEKQKEKKNIENLSSNPMHADDFLCISLMIKLERILHNMDGYMHGSVYT
jgi:hypothetical protein